MTISFWFDFASTYSYPAAMRIASLAADYEVAVDWRPFLLGPIMHKFGWQDSPFNLYPAKGRYMWRDLDRICARQGIAFQRPSIFPRQQLLATRIACLYSECEWLPAFARAVFRANFEQDLDIAEPAVITACVPAECTNVADIINRASSEASKLLLREQTAFAETAGIFGAPSVLVGRELFWGNDRLEQACEYAVALKK